MRTNTNDLSSAIQIIGIYAEMFQRRGFEIDSETTSQITLQRYGKTIKLYYDAKFSSYDVIINASVK